jgi:hypothetical protein
MTPGEVDAHLERLRTPNPPRFTPDEIDAFFAEHLLAEQRVDIDAVMATVAPEAIYESHPMGIVMQGHVAIREYYERSLAKYMATVRRSGYRYKWYGGHSIVLEVAVSIRQPDGSWGSSFRMGAIEFDGRGRVTSERAYMAGAQLDLLKDSLRDDFGDVAGVYRLT